MSNEPSNGQRDPSGTDKSRLPDLETEPNEGEGKQAASGPQDEEEQKDRMITKIYNVLFADKAAVWTAIFTCVLAIFSYLLWKVNDAATQLAIATQAASVSSIGPAVIKQANPDGKTLKGWSVAFNWINSGSTPTKTAEVQSNIYVGTASPSKGLDFNQLPQDRIVTVVIAPKSGIQTTPGFISLQDAEDMQLGEKHVFVWGWAVYNDGFSARPRLSEYCFTFEGVSFSKADHTDFTGDAQFINSPCGVHFCFNEDCEDYKDRTK